MKIPQNNYYTSSVSFRSIKGIAKVNPEDKSGDPINVENLLISGNKEGYKLFNINETLNPTTPINPDKSYQIIDIDSVDDRSNLLLDKEAKAAVKKMNNGIMRLNDNSVADVGTFIDSFADIQGRSQLNINKASSTNPNLSCIADYDTLSSISVSNKSKLNLKEANPKVDIRTYDAAEANVDSMQGEYTGLYQRDHSKSHVGTISNKAMVTVTDKAKTQVDKAEKDGLIYRDSYGSTAVIKKDNRSIKDKLISQIISPTGITIQKIINKLASCIN
ncbi:MAG: hypothetical protein ACD_20C00007G0013 [uncultured bacterium]|nr:MAG: hypothetical protein ACD_20C00007G0013 [uncultured bacterium]HBH17481.1 hypothetical protein [Cyanobacteria bacterium UBA9579]